MSQASAGLSDTERRAARGASPRQLLYSRKMTAHVLGGVSESTVKRLEDEGLLTRIRLGRSATAQVFHSADEVHALAERRADA